MNIGTKLCLVLVFHISTFSLADIGFHATVILESGQRVKAWVYPSDTQRWKFAATIEGNQPTIFSISNKLKLELDRYLLSLHAAHRSAESLPVLNLRRVGDQTLREHWFNIASLSLEIRLGNDIEFFFVKREESSLYELNLEHIVGADFPPYELSRGLFGCGVVITRKNHTLLLPGSPTTPGTW